MLDSRENEEQSKIRYWLDKIRAFGGDSPVIVVLNKRDQGGYEPDESRLKQDYRANLRSAFFRTICEDSEKRGRDGEGISELRAALIAGIQALDNVRQLVPASYLAAKHAIEEAARQRKHLNQAEYDALCEGKGVDDSLDRTTLLNYLRQLGTLYHYDSDAGFGALPDTYVLDPEWVTRGVYSILTDLTLRNAGGVLCCDDVRRIFGGVADYPDRAQEFIVAMMEADLFQLCFRIPEGPRRWLVPELLSSDEPSHGIDPSSSLNLQYHYRFLPVGLIPRFVVRMHNTLKQGAAWRNGVVLNIDGQRVLIRGVREERRVFVSVDGREPAARRALAVVRNNLAIIHAGMKHLEVEERVPLPDKPEVTVSYKYLLEQEREEGPLWEWRPEGADRKYTVRELLDGIEEYRVPEEKSLERAEPMITQRGEVFISYAHEDAIYLQEVRKLANDLRAWGVDAWIDQYVDLPGPPKRWPT